jgi:hypothetical protein
VSSASDPANRNYPIVPHTDALSEALPALQSEVAHLHDLQKLAMKRATFVGMNLVETQEFDKRAERIRHILKSLGRNL